MQRLRDPVIFSLRIALVALDDPSLAGGYDTNLFHFLLAFMHGIAGQVQSPSCCLHRFGLLANE